LSKLKKPVATISQHVQLKVASLDLEKHMGDQHVELHIHWQCSKLDVIEDPPAPKLRNKTKQNKKNDLISKGTPKENKRKKRKTRNRIHFAIVGSTAPPLDFMHSFRSVDLFFNCVGFCFFV
jgi:hypothetical protein